MAPEPTPSPSPSPPAPEAPKEPEVFKGEEMASYGTTGQDEELEVGEEEEEATAAPAPEPGHAQSIRTRKKKVLKKRPSPDAADPSVDTLPPEGG